MSSEQERLSVLDGDRASQHPAADWREEDRALAEWVAGLRRVRTLIGQAHTAQEHLDLRTVRQRARDLRTALDEARAATEHTVGTLETFRFPHEGPALEAWVAEFLAELRNAGLPVEGEYPRYQIFPLEVRIDAANEQVFLGRRRIGALRPKSLAARIIREHGRLMNSSFNGARFLTLLLKAAEFAAPSLDAPSVDVPLGRIYQVLTLRSGTASYTQLEFAFDIYRLRRDSDLVVGDRIVSFHHGRHGTKFAIPRTTGGVEEMTFMRIERTGDHV